MSANSGRIRWALLIFISWIVATSLSLFYLGNRHYDVFAGDDSWHNDNINTQLLGLPSAQGFQLVHVFDSSCACNLRAKAHIRQLEQDDTLAQVGQHFVDASRLAAIGFYLPATPAVLVFYAGQLIYAGPYASGPLCALDDSLIAPILKQELILPGPWLNSNVTTCRCPVT